jgi:hypothetical protein
MRSTLLKIGFGILVLSLMSASAFAQGRGRGRGLEKKQAVFVNDYNGRNGRIDRRGRNQNWKCSVFLNCHDARDGRLDGHGPRANGNNALISRGTRVGYRNRFNMNDYWRRRHVTYVDHGWRYRNRIWRDR